MKHLGEKGQPGLPGSPEAVSQDSDRIRADVGRQSGSTFYRIPERQGFSKYLPRLEQPLAHRCALRLERREDFLHGEREIIQGNIELCVENRTNVVTRMLLAETLLAMKEVRPNILREFEEKISALQQTNPLDEPERSVLEACSSKP